MKSIYRCSTYDFLEIGDICETDKADIELAALCVNGVYGAAFIISQGRLHIIFNPEKTNLCEMSFVIELAGYKVHLHRAERKYRMLGQKNNKNKKK